MMSGYFSAYSRMTAAVPSVERSSFTSTSKAKSVCWLTKPSRVWRIYFSWL